MEDDRELGRLTASRRTFDHDDTVRSERGEDPLSLLVYGKLVRFHVRIVGEDTLRVSPNRVRAWTEKCVGNAG
jgi:hypothetical protein